MYFLEVIVIFLLIYMQYTNLIDEINQTDDQELNQLLKSRRTATTVGKVDKNRISVNTFSLRNSLILSHGKNNKYKYLGQGGGTNESERPYISIIG